MTLFLIMISSGFGAVCRQFANNLCTKYCASSFPVATLIVNLIGSFIIGIVAHHFESASAIYALLAIGFCGGFTTFSTHLLEVYERFLLKSYKQMIIYILLTIVLSIGACYLGYII